MHRGETDGASHSHDVHSPGVPFAACNCHGHAADCFYDPDVERQQASLDIRGVYAGGGVCINCQVRRWASRVGVSL